MFFLQVLGKAWGSNGGWNNLKGLWESVLGKKWPNLGGKEPMDPTTVRLKLKSILLSLVSK